MFGREFNRLNTSVSDVGWNTDIEKRGGKEEMQRRGRFSRQIVGGKKISD